VSAVPDAVVNVVCPVTFKVEERYAVEPMSAP
jgi:hypothetical protein